MTVSGSGFDPSTRIDVFLDSTDTALAVSNASGAVSIPLQIPTSTQPGTHWITLDETHGNRAAQAQFTIVTSWLQGGYGPSSRSFNPLENTVSTANADQLSVAWSRQVSVYGNVKPFVVLRNNLYVYDENGLLHAYSPTGARLWLAGTGQFRGQQVALTANGGSVFAGNDNGVVRAFSYLCRTDGGVCATQQWQANIGTQVNGLTYRGGLLYASGNDGLVHVINSATGAIGTSITPFGSSGPATQPVAFGADGTMYIVQGTALAVAYPWGGASRSTFGGTASQPAAGNTDGYVTTADGNLHEVYGWTTPIGAAGCSVKPAVAKGVVYAASCSTLGAYDADTGALIWQIPVSSATGLALANGVLYACWGYRVRTYAASYGGKLGDGGLCAGAPEIVGGTLYSVDSGLYAATLDGAINTVSIARPDPRQLRPSLRTPRDGRRHLG